MTINLATQRLIDDGESADVEFVLSPSDHDKIGASVAAFLNSNGGSIVVGLDSHASIGTIAESDAATMREFLYKAISPCSVMSVSYDEVSSGHVLVIEVPNGLDTPYVFDGRVFIRRGKTTHPADAEDIRQMVLEKGTHVQRWEQRPSPTLRSRDLVHELMKRTVDFGMEKRGFDFDDPQNLDVVLQQLDLIQFGQYTNAADVSFGEKVAQRLPQTRVRAVRYETDRMGDFVDDQLFEGPALTLFHDIMAFLKRNISIAATFTPGQAQRNDVPAYPFSSIREGIINALVHRDYAAFSGSIKVEIYPNRLEIWNTGTLPKSLTPKKLKMAQHESVLVNPDISLIFYLNGHMERVGRGTYNIVRECRDAGLKTPEWKSIAQGTRLTFFTQRADLQKELNKRQLAFLAETPPLGEVVTVDYRDAFAQDVTPRQARRDLENLEDYGFLVRRGVGRGTVFVRTEKALK